MTASASSLFAQPLRLRTGLFWSLYGVWYRHLRVYTKTLLANATPPVLEPLFFFLAIAFGLGGFVQLQSIEGLSYKSFVASGMLVGSAMFTSVFETTYGTFVRLVYQRTYDAMLSTHLRLGEIFVGEMLFAATKGAVFATVVLLVTTILGARPTWWCLLVPVVGFAAAYLFAGVGLIVTSYVKMINNFSFFTTGVITPMFYFSGTFFPIRGHYLWLDVVATVVPLTPPIGLARALFKAEFGPREWVDLAVLATYIALFHVFALRRMKKRVLR